MTTSVGKLTEKKNDDEVVKDTAEHIKKMRLRKHKSCGWEPQKKKNKLSCDCGQKKKLLEERFLEVA